MIFSALTEWSTSFSNIRGSNPNFLALLQAKALAEKNMRDLLVQREQAERNVINLQRNFSKYILNNVFHLMS